MNILFGRLNNFTTVPLQIHHKKWDSDFFGFAVADIIGTGDTEEITKVYSKLKRNKYKLAYWKVPHDDAILNASAEKLDIQLIDTRVTFIKDINDAPLNSFLSIQKYEGKINPKLISLALQSGEYSRFKIDQNFPAKTFEKLYTTWITKAVEEKYVKEIFVSKHGEKLTGFVTVDQIHAERAEIDQIAVDKMYRGKSIGKELIHAAESWSYKNNYKQLQVATQKRNVSACKFYLACRFVIEKEENIYHLWL
jgi:dTDP-4-amino-4,6-dideoxy-D-galactose acyltransferase